MRIVALRLGAPLARFTDLILLDGLDLSFI